MDPTGFGGLDPLYSIRNMMQPVQTEEHQVQLEGLDPQNVRQSTNSRSSSSSISYCSSSSSGGGGSNNNMDHHLLVSPGNNKHLTNLSRYISTNNTTASMTMNFPVDYRTGTGSHRQNTESNYAHLQEKDDDVFGIPSVQNLRVSFSSFEEGMSIPFHSLAMVLQEARELIKLQIDCTSLIHDNRTDLNTFTQALKDHPSLREFKLSFTHYGCHRPSSQKRCITSSATAITATTTTAAAADDDDDDDDGTTINSILEALAFLPTLETVSIYVKPYPMACSSSGLHCASIERLLRHASNLKTLKFAGLQLNEEHVQSIVQTLQTQGRNEMQKLRELRLCHCGIGNQGAIRLAELVGKNTWLEQLDLSYNRVGDTGCIAFAKALEVNSNLKCLYLHRNKEIGKHSYLSLKHMLERNFVLEELWIPISDEQEWNVLHFYLSLNSTGQRRRVLQNVYTTQEDWVETLLFCESDLSVLFYYISEAPPMVLL